MEGPLKELAKLEKLTAKTAAKGKTTATNDPLDSLLQFLRQAKDSVENDGVSEEVVAELVQAVESRKKEVDDRQKEWYGALARLGKSLDKKFVTPLPTFSSLFTSEKSAAALERTIALHFLRTGQFDTAEVFLEESNVEISPVFFAQCLDLHRILTALNGEDVVPALQWAESNRSFLESHSSPLEFHLHRSQYIRLLLASHQADTSSARSYANTRLRPFWSEHSAEIKRLMACIAFLPLTRLQNSPYSDLASPSLHLDLAPLFTKEYCTSLGMSRQVPLRVVGDIGGGGALARIEKGRKVMRERKSEWSQSDELPIGIPLPPENRYHSIFACPVSKEQSTEQNPPMMMTCGHVITKDSLQKLIKPGGRVKCPYCPTESQLAKAIRVYF